MATKGLVADKPRGSRKQQLYESRREREFYRYYEPIRQLTQDGPPLCNLYDEAAVKAHIPSSSPDRALTAFCQLGALRVGTRRAMLFFFDSNYAYVLAEATRTLSLVDDSVHEIEDHLWLGHSVIPRGFSICEETVCKLPSDEESTQSGSDRALLHIINDLDKDVQFCDRPYVTDGPKAKFYAGVPITTPKGIAIGAYCLLDDRKREGLDEKGIAFMKDMAATVMTHLEMVRAKAEHERGTQMVCGLNAFIEGASTLQHWEEETERRDRRLMGRPISPPSRPPLNTLPLSAPPPTAALRPEASPDRLSSNGSQDSADSVPTVAKVADSLEPGKGMIESTPAKTSQRADLRDQLIANNVRSAFQRASALVREAVDVDGAVYLDATPATYGGLVETTQDSSDQTSDALISGAEATGSDSEGRWRVKGVPGVEKPCKVLASSHSARDRYNHRGELQSDIQATNITEKFLRSLLRRNPQGKIWNFNEDGDASSDDESSEGCGHRRGCSCKPPRSPSDSSEGSSHRRKARRKRARIDDGREIQRLFPGVRSMALVGMWDQNRGRWFSACALWTYSPLRLFSPESELNYMSAFNDVIMAEVHRLEALNADKAKSDFISSISHELRSPLHGILGSVEVLQEQPSEDSFSTSLVSQIDICGRTLLDIVDHLLDYSKINHHARIKHVQPDNSNSKLRRRLSSSHGHDRKSQLGNMLAFDVDVNLDKVTEEVVETAVYSFCCARDKDFILNRKVTIMLDIDRSANVNWKCKVPTGGWKRICINLVSNALKYTGEGFIKVSLKAEPIPGKKRKQSVIFTVSDSGRGMSKDFLENHLFKAFAQEDSLTEGTGLGMSLVAKIVKAMGGKIEVRSEKGTGTTMTVTVPVELVSRSSKEAAVATPDGTHVLVDGASVGILGFLDVNAETPSSSAKAVRTMLLKNLERNCDSLGFQVHKGEEAEAAGCDAYLINEQDLRDFAASSQTRLDDSFRVVLGKPAIVLCDTAISLRNLRASSLATTLNASKIEYIAQPFGTEQLSRAVRNCTDANPRGRKTTDGSEEQAARGPDSAANVMPLTNGHLSENSFNLPVRPNGDLQFSESSSAVQSPPIPSPRPPLKADTGNDYLSHRSRLTGDRPTSPHVVDPAAVKKPSVRKAPARPAPSSGLSLLLVDDNQINLQLLVNYATKQGHQKAIATDGAQAVEVYKAAYLGTKIAHAQSDSPKRGHVAEPGDSSTPLQKPQVILMDINMPVLNGFEATRQIRMFEQHHGVQPAHIIALTGLGSASAQQEAFSSGVDLFLTKPVRLKELTRVLAEYKSTMAEEKTHE